MIRRPPSSTLFPYTTLFRSRDGSYVLGRRRFVERDADAPIGEVPEIQPGALGSRTYPLRRRSQARRNFQADRIEKARSEEHTSELQSLTNLVCRLLLEKKNK